MTLAAAVNDPGHRYWPLLPGLAMPTLVVGGGPTSGIPQDVLARAAAAVPGATLVTIAAGHHVHEERSADFADTVLGWLLS